MFKFIIRKFKSGIHSILRKKFDVAEVILFLLLMAFSMICFVGYQLWQEFYYFS